MKSRNRNAAQLMLVLALLAGICAGVPFYLGEGVTSLATLALPFGLPDTIGGISTLLVTYFAGTVLSGLVLAALPPGLPRKKILFGGFMLLAGGALASLVFRSPTEQLCWRILMGIGWGMHFSAWLAMGIAYFPRYSVVVVASMVFVVDAGGVAFNRVARLMLDHAGWREWLPAVCVGTAVLIFIHKTIAHLFARQRVARPYAPPPEAAGAAATPWSTAPLLLASATFFLVLAVHMLLVDYPAHIRHVGGLSAKTLALVRDVALLAAFFAPIGGWLAKRHGIFNVLLIVMPVSAIVGALLFLRGNVPLPVLLPLFFLGSVAIQAFLYISILAAMMESVTSAHSMRVAGLFYAVIAFSQCFAPVLFRSLQSSLGWTTAALLQFSLCLLLCAALVWLARRVLRRAGTQPVV